MMEITLGFSPCPNDTFIFDGLVNGRIDTGELKIKPVLADVEELNRKAMAGELDVIKLSYHAFAYVRDQYALLNSGGALGINCGPILMTKHVNEPDENQINGMSIAIPGKFTTANFLMSMAYPDATRKTEFLFSDIESAVMEGKTDLGVIIHENRFTYQDKGLRKVRDLGEYWNQLTGLPIPLGGIAVRRSIEDEVRIQLDQLIHESVKLAKNDPSLSADFVEKYAREMDPDVRRKHIELYVNEFTLDLGEQGRAAVNFLFDLAHEKKIIPNLDQPIFSS